MDYKFEKDIIFFCLYFVKRESEKKDLYLFIN